MTRCPRRQQAGTRLGQVDAPQPATPMEKEFRAFSLPLAMRHSGIQKTPPIASHRSTGPYRKESTDKQGRLPGRKERLSRMSFTFGNSTYIRTQTDVKRMVPVSLLFFANLP